MGMFLSKNQRMREQKDRGAVYLPPALLSATLKQPYAGKPTELLELAYDKEVSAPGLHYQWKIASSPASDFDNIDGAIGSAYTPNAEDIGRFIKCEVTAFAGAVGVVTSNAKKVAE